ncbi:nucleotidyltransferase domain-containing protein [Streptomyces halstedii]|uniref:nucleotidyltransferase domain-containing protein n=1 Tax=Streptomyces halstedii TaxID=1944 RepID=UPI0036CDD1A0
MTTTTPPAPLSPLEEPAYAHRPPQLTVLADLVQALSGIPAVTRLLVRGSLATGTADRLSDVDLVVAVRDERLPALMGSLDAVMSTEFGTLLPGWRDTIVGDLGGAGFVYLLPHDGHLLQLDLYLCPDSAVDALRRRIGPGLLWQETRPDTGPHPHRTRTRTRTRTPKGRLRRSWPVRQSRRPTARHCWCRRWFCT